MPTYSPDTEAVLNTRPYTRETNEKIAARINEKGFLSRLRPGVYMDCIDSVLNVRPDIDLVVADARSTDSVRAELQKHQEASKQYSLALFPERASQWKVLNDVLSIHATPQTQYFVYTSSDIIWTMDWVSEAIKEFEADPKLQIIFPCVNSGDPSLPCQASKGPRDIPLIDPPYQEAARAKVLNAYAFIMRIDFLKTYGGYPTLFRNCFTESFLYYMCEAMGGKMRLMPRGWLYHHNGVDGWTGEGGFYHYDKEKPIFDETMNKLQKAREDGKMTINFLKDLLYVETGRD